MRLAALSVRLGEGNHVAFSRSVTVPTLAASATWPTLLASEGTSKSTSLNPQKSGVPGDWRSQNQFNLANGTVPPLGSCRLLK